MPRLKQALEKQAKSLLELVRGGDSDGLARTGRHFGPNVTIGPRRAQHVLAREYGFDSWSHLLENLETGNPLSVAHLQATVSAALESESHSRLQQIASDCDWQSVDPVMTNCILQLIGMYGDSGRTRRFADIIQQLLDRGCRPDLKTCALLVLNDQAERLLTDNPALGELTDDDQATALHHAAVRGNAYLTAKLCDMGVEVNAADAYDETPLMKALHAGPWKPSPADDVIKILRQQLSQRGAEIDCFTLAALGDADGLALWLAHHPGEANDTDHKGRTALFCAARNNHVGTVRALLDRGADPNVECTDGQTPLSTACLHSLSQECDSQIISDLLTQGARPSIESAIILEDLVGVGRFLDRDPDLLAGQDHESALGYAIHTWRPNVIRYLISRGARLTRDNWGHIERIAGDNTALVGELRGTPPR